MILLFQAFQRIFNLRKYSGSISFVPAPGFEAFGEPCNQKGESISYTCSPSHKEPSKGHQQGYQGPDIGLESLSWRKISGPFVSVWLHNVPWGGEDTMAAPDAKVVFLSCNIICIRCFYYHIYCDVNLDANLNSSEF